MTMRVRLLVLLNLILSGCASEPPVQPPPPPPTIVNLQIESATDINSDNDGKASPVMLRVYELREQSNFNAADFFALFDKEQSTLAGDLVRKQELLLKPGDNKTLTIEPETDVRTLGFFAAFRQLDTAQWRASSGVVPHQTQTLIIKLKNNQLTVEPLAPAKTPEPAPVH
jgi:type VI secretion system protein VasD